MAEQQQTATLIKRAALLRAAGASWGDVAKQVDREASTVRGWPCKHREMWNEAYTDAVGSILANIEPEAISYQLQLINEARESDDLKVKALGESAAHSLLAHCGRLRGTKVQHSGEIGTPLTDVVAAMAAEARREPDDGIEVTDGADQPRPALGAAPGGEA